ncbi:uncharacterized protein LOC129744175 [Uranotaenia lowii]|uniref:uncharacterized protein LOC129744175 n=1 Tax=Uranotaenia lowii TaxID=190385 RepID=UPI0024793DD0|nr:uncharacterized protein LOC129744175 [Uranotaenia lowii]
MDVQNQIYLLAAVLGGVCALLLVCIAILAVVVVSTRKMVTSQKTNKPYANYGFQHDPSSHNITDDFRPPKAEPIHQSRQTNKSNLAKPRNDESYNLGRKEKVSVKGPKQRDDRKKRRQSESGDTSGRDFDSAFDNEINNAFDFDDDYDDQDSVESYRNNPYGQQQKGRNQPPPPQQSRPAQGNSRSPGRAQGYGGGYNAGNPHEGKTYFNGRDMY